jgi:cytochrome c oxidase assembly protein subunit 11|tara:strand:+ start:1289 stop:1723 length:435 start_codon:yes stop_codon:yes gene_type:complete
LLKDKKIIFILSFLAIVIIVSVLFLLNKTNNNQRISAKLITSVHKDLPLEFKTDKNLIILKPGEVKTINYYVRNLSEKKITGMATFQVYPPELKDYMTKMNCFCYEEQTFKVGEKEKYALVLLVDPNVTKNIKEAIIQFIFFKK